MKNAISALIGGIIGALIALVIVLSIIPAEEQTQTIITNSEQANASAVYDQTVNGVVTVLNYQSQQTLQQYLNGESGDLVEAGIGSGFIYKKESGYYYALTNNHVIDGNDNLKILTHDQSAKDDLADAEVIGSDTVYDIAVIRFKSDQDLTVLQMGDSDDITVGEAVYAIGSPYGTDFAGSISSGIISAPIRKFERLAHSYEYIQTDAAINPGNSGGPLINSSGEVIGVDSMKIADTEADNMGFAIPINTALDIADQLENGEVPSDSDTLLKNYTITRKDDTSSEETESEDNNDSNNSEEKSSNKSLLGQIIGNLQ